MTNLERVLEAIKRNWDDDCEKTDFPQVTVGTGVGDGYINLDITLAPKGAPQPAQKTVTFVPDCKSSLED